MTLREFFAAELDRKVERSRRALQQLPEGKADWKPHDKSMKFEDLADMVATMPSWVARQITQDSLDIAPRQRIKRRARQCFKALITACGSPTAMTRRLPVAR